MSAFIVRFIGSPENPGCGVVRHVATGEEANFANMAELLRFFEEFLVMNGILRASEQEPPHTDSVPPPGVS